MDKGFAGVNRENGSRIALKKLSWRDAEKQSDLFDQLNFKHQLDNESATNRMDSHKSQNLLARIKAILPAGQQGLSMSISEVYRL